VNDFASTAAAMNDVFNQNFLQYRHHVIEVDYPTFEANKIFKKEKRTTNVENTDMKNRTRRSVMKKNRMNQSVLRRNKTVWKANQESMKEIHRIRSVQEEQNEPQMLNNCMKILSFLILIEILILMFRMSTN
jgi:ATP-dependent Zn protease